MTIAACARTSITLVHYNIKELESAKLKNRNTQMENVAAVLDHLQDERDIDLLSVNEIQYDLPGVPSAKDTSDGANIHHLANLLGREDHHPFFSPANTGRKALKRPNGEYTRSDAPDAIAFADQVNFGLFPAQYSTALLSQFEIVHTRIFREVLWRDTRPKLDLTIFTDGAGKKLPDDMPLFDKSFNDLTLRDRQGREFHLIMLHTVPAYHFGNMKSPNYHRNADQLRFLEWYVTGSSDAQFAPPKGVSPLVPGTPFIIVGDLNVDIKSQHPGAAVLQSMLRKGVLSWMPEFPGTYLGEGLQTPEENRTLLNLDYIFYSAHFENESAGVYLPRSQFKEWECSSEEQPLVDRAAPAGMVEITQIREQKLCRGHVSHQYWQVAQGSDHLPIWVTLNWKN